MFNIVQKTESPKPRRRRSSSLDSKKIIKCREENTHKTKFLEKPMKKYASITNLFNPDNGSNEKGNSSPKQKLKQNVDNNFNLFVNWFKDFKSVKSQLTSGNDSNIFKNGYPRKMDLNIEDNSKTILYLVNNTFKIDNEYEVYLINNYNERLIEFLKWSKNSNEDNSVNEYSNCLNLIDKQSFEENDNGRRSSEIMALIIQSKNQPMQSFLPRVHHDHLSAILCACEFEVFYMNQDRKNEKNIKSIARCGILTNIDITIFARNNMKLKETFLLKHLYVGQCHDAQIANIDSCIRIGGPYGSDMIIRFPNPQTRNEWNTYITEEITSHQEIIKNISTNIGIFNDINPIPSAPLVCKTISINGTTTGLLLKKMAMESFEIPDIDIKDLSIFFSIKSKENILHDDVSLLVLQEHVNNTLDSSCQKACLDNDKTVVSVKIKYYLRSNKSINDNLFKEGIKSKKPTPAKPKLNKYDINLRWSDNQIPNWLMSLLADLYNEGAKCEGIFRVSGSVAQSDEYVNQISETDDVKIETSIHNKANILKKFLNIIDGSLLKSFTKEQFAILTSDINPADECNKQDELLLEIMQKTPENHLKLFQHILVVLDNILKNSHYNQMNSSNLATCFSQNLFKHLSDDAVKINKLFEFILILIPQLVNQTTYANIVLSYQKRKVSIESGESFLNSSGGLNLDLDSNSPTTSRAYSDATDELKSPSPSRQPVVPPRRKKGHNRSPQNLDLPTKEEPILRPPVLPLKKRESTFKRQSAPLEYLKNDHICQLDETDSSIKVESKIRTTPSPQRTSRNRNTCTTLSPTESQPINNFYRQNQVNRKHQQQKNTVPTDNIKQPKPVTKLVRSNGRLITNGRSRSTTKIMETEPVTPTLITRQPLKTSFNYSATSWGDLQFTQNHYMKERRSSSDNQVKRLREQFENTLSASKAPPLPVKKQSMISSDNRPKRVLKYVKEIEETKTNKSPHTLKLVGAIRPRRDSPNAQEELTKELSPRPFSSNSLSLQDRLNDSNDDDVTYI